MNTENQIQRPEIIDEIDSYPADIEPTKSFPRLLSAGTISSFDANGFLHRLGVTTDIRAALKPAKFRPGGIRITPRKGKLSRNDRQRAKAQAVRVANQRRKRK